MRNCYRSSGRLTIDSDSFHISSPYLFSLLFFSSETLPKLNFYKQVAKADFPNLHDYNCAETRVFGACELAVYSVKEAKYMCDLDKSCKAFVTTSNVLWSGKLQLSVMFCFLLVFRLTA